jgi:hypothetical protein
VAANLCRKCIWSSMETDVPSSPVVAYPGNFPHPADNSLQDAANSLLVSINSLFCAIKFPVPDSRELSVRA